MIVQQKYLFEKLYRLYENNGYYDKKYQDDLANSTIRKNLNNFSASLFDKTIKPLRTVVNRSVEFYVSKISSSMQVSSENQAVVDSINQFLTWSNFPAMKPISLRNMTLLGNAFIKVNANKNKVFAELIDPRYITTLKLDNRGYITELRIDLPVEGDDKNLTFTEYWNKEYFSTWTHALGANAPLDTLGTPDDYGYLTELGIDFIPIVQIKFKDIGENYGISCVYHALDKIDEANREASRLSDLLFRYNKPVTVVSASSKDGMGRPIPAPKLQADKELYNPDDESTVYLSGDAQINSLIPQIDYDAALNVLNAMMNELQEDLPELRYYSLKDGNLSGKAIKLMLASAVDRANEAQANYIQGIKRINQIALTLGKFWGLFQLSGTYEDGSFEHEIIVEDMFPLDDGDKATMLKDLTTAGLSLATSLKMLGFDDAFIATALKEKQEQESQSLANNSASLGNALNSFNAGV